MGINSCYVYGFSQLGLLNNPSDISQSVAQNKSAWFDRLGLLSGLGSLDSFSEAMVCMVHCSAGAGTVWSSINNLRKLG